MSRRTPTLLRVAGAVLAAALLAAGCSSGSSGPKSGSGSTPAATATAMPTPTDVPAFQPSAKPIEIGKAAASQDQVDSSSSVVGGANGAPDIQPQPYWASDYHHYKVVNGAWVSDYYMAQTNDPNGRPMPGEIGVYDTATNNEVFIFDTNLAGFTAFRDLTNPLFRVVYWAAWPTGQTATDANLTYQVALDGNTSSLVWFTQAQLNTIVNAGLGYRIGFAGQPAATTSLWQQWTSTAANTNGVLFGEDLNKTWVQPNCADGCTTF
jgi:hypothetical protein